MTDNTELKQLRAELAELKTTVAAQAGRITALESKLAHERAERLALPKILVPHAAETRRALADLETTLEMYTRSFDIRIGEVAAQQPPASGPPLPLDVARAIAKYVRELLARDEWTRIDGDVACLLVISLRLTSQLAWALSMKQEERIVDDGGPKAG